MEDVELLSRLDEDSRSRVLRMMGELILATDMAKHRDKTTELQRLLDSQQDAQSGVALANGAGSYGAGARGDSGVVSLLLQNILKAADVSNQARCKQAADFWNAAIYEEFYAEGDLDRL